VNYRGKATIEANVSRIKALRVSGTCGPAGSPPRSVFQAKRLMERVLLGANTAPETLVFEHGTATIAPEAQALLEAAGHKVVFVSKPA